MQVVDLTDEPDLEDFVIPQPPQQPQQPQQPRRRPKSLRPSSAGAVVISLLDDEDDSDFQPPKAAAASKPAAASCVATTTSNEATRRSEDRSSPWLKHEEHVAKDEACQSSLLVYLPDESNKVFPCSSQNAEELGQLVYRQIRSHFRSHKQNVEERGKLRLKDMVKRAAQQIQSREEVDIAVDNLYSGTDWSCRLRKRPNFASTGFEYELDLGVTPLRPRQPTPAADISEVKFVPAKPTISASVSPTSTTNNTPTKLSRPASERSSSGGSMRDLFMTLKSARHTQVRNEAEDGLVAHNLTSCEPSRTKKEETVASLKDLAASTTGVLLSASPQLEDNDDDEDDNLDVDIVDSDDDAGKGGGKGTAHIRKDAPDGSTASQPEQSLPASEGEKKAAALPEQKTHEAESWSQPPQTKAAPPVTSTTMGAGGGAGVHSAAQMMLLKQLLLSQPRPPNPFSSFALPATLGTAAAAAAGATMAAKRSMTAIAAESQVTQAAGASLATPASSAPSTTSASSASSASGSSSTNITAASPVATNAAGSSSASATTSAPLKPRKRPRPINAPDASQQPSGVRPMTEEEKEELKARRRRKQDY